MSADLHIHSTASDGTLVPKKIVKISKELGFSTISLADHDTVAGIPEALEAAKKAEIEFIPAVELSCVYQQRDVHILGYFIRWNDMGLNKYLFKIQQLRLKRAEKMVKLLNKHGLSINFEEVITETNGNMMSIGRPHLARTLVRKGLLQNVEEAFQKYLARGAPCFVEKYEHNPFELINKLKEYGGIPVLAHPGVSGGIKLIKKLKKAGLRGLEVYHPDHTSEQVKTYIKIAQEEGLLVTGGSDCHGTGSEKGLRLGMIRIPDKYVAMIKREREQTCHKTYRTR